MKYTFLNLGPRQGRPPDGTPGTSRQSPLPHDPPSRSASQTHIGHTLSRLDFIKAAARSFLRGQLAYLALTLSLTLPKLHWPPSSQHRRGPSRLGTYMGRALRARGQSTAPPCRPASSQEGPEGMSWVHGCTLRRSFLTQVSHGGATAPEARAESRRASSSPGLPTTLVSSITQQQ